MSHENELSYKSLRKECDPNLLKFNNTAELEVTKDIIGQERAVKALEFGLKIKTRGYNIYISGVTGTGKTSYAYEYIKNIAATQKAPPDWCYIYNFEKPNQPIALSLPAGLGKVFQKDMEDFVKVVQQEIPRAFDSEDYEREKSAIIKEFQNKRNRLLEALSADAEKQGFKVKTTNTGIYFLPVVEGKTLSEREYGDLDEHIKSEIDGRSDIVQTETVEVIRKIKSIEKEAQEKVEEWEDKVALYAIGIPINDLKEKYANYCTIINYLEKIQENILENLDEFIENEVEDQQQMVMPWFKRVEQSSIHKYRVNLLVDNSKLEGAPVISDFNPTYYNLLGKVEYENEFGSMMTDFTMIKPGLFHQANGGYLILQMSDILNNVQSWEVLKRIIRTRQISIENMKEQLGLVAVSTLKPDPIPLDAKIILVGSERIYQLFYQFDEDFKKLFKIKVDFDDEISWNDENIMKLATFIAGFCQREKTKHFDRTGVSKVIEYCSRIIEDQNKLCTKYNDIAEVLCESCVWADIEESDFVSEEHVKKALCEKIYRSNKYDNKLLQKLQDGTIMIDTDGEVVGQINGLTILDIGDYFFGKPSKITANTFIGEEGIVNIEREVEMSGTLHAKGVLILSGYIGQKYAQDMPLSLSASLCFEQLYGGVEGDSASSAELYAILSSLAEVPIKQYIAVTGSVNQKGEIQPIGGATQKIEGFFELCKSRGLTGKHGVIIPHQNEKNLSLNDDVIEAVKAGLFHIYTVKSIDEGIKILTGMEAGNKNEEGNYPENTINYKVHQKLKKYNQVVANFVKESKNV